MIRSRVAVLARAVATCAVLLALGAASAQHAAPVRLTLPWSGASPVTVGTGLDVDLVEWARNACLARTDGDEVWLDGAGAVQTDVTVELVKDYASLTKTLNLEVDYKAKADVTIAELKGGKSVHLNTKYDSFAQDESRSLAIVVKAQSDYGRKGLRSYKLDQGSGELVSANKLPEFRQRCGTHTVVAQRNLAMVAVVILLSEASRSSRQALEASYASSFSASLPLKAATIAASADLRASWKNLVETAKRTSTMRVVFESKGGGGISDGLKAAATANPENVDGILKALTVMGASFTQANSAPAEYILVPNSVLGVNLAVTDAFKRETLNGYYLQLARVDQALKRIENYKGYPALYQFYDTSEGVLRLRGYRKQLVEAIEACAVHSQCTYEPPKDLGVVFAEDIITPESFALQCNYRRFDSTDGRVKLNVLSYAAVVLRGEARLARFVDMNTAMLNRLGPISEPPRSEKGAWVAFKPTAPRPEDVDGRYRFFAQVDYEVFHPDVEVSTGSVNIRNEAQMARVRADMLSSLYAVHMQARNGFFIQNVVGPPFGGDCPLKMPVN